MKTSAPLSATDASAPVSVQRGFGRRLLDLDEKAPIAVALIVIVAFFSIASSDNIYWSVANFQGMASSLSSILLLAVGSTYLLITGNLDLSIGANLVLSSVIGAKLMNYLQDAGIAQGTVLLIGIPATILVGLLLGLLNGLITTKFGIPSFIVTLGTLGVYQGVAELMTTGFSERSPKLLQSGFGFAYILGVPVVFVVAGILVLILGIVLARTVFGVHCYAVGSNRLAAVRNGIEADRTTIGAFCLMGALAGTAGVIDLARFTSVSVASNGTTALAAISAAVIGGTSLFGGRGSVLGTVIGALIPIALLRGLVIQGFPASWQTISIGVIVVGAVAFDQYRRRRT